MPDPAIAAALREAPCEYPVVAATGYCCGTAPCSLEWFWPCAEQGGCIDHMTCGGCATPIFPEAVERAAREGEA